MNDNQKLTQIQSGDENCFEQVFREYYEMLCVFALKYLNDADEAEEIVQSLFVKFWQKREEISINTSLKSYLYQSTRNACLNHLKHEKIKLEHQKHESGSVPQYSTNDTVIELELESKIQAALDQLPPERQKIFLMSRNEGLKYKEIAEQLRISVKTVENQMGKALRFLREELAEYLSIIIFVLINILENFQP